MLFHAECTETKKDVFHLSKGLNSLDSLNYLVFFYLSNYYEELQKVCCLAKIS
jgi:hypothetical protein